MACGPHALATQPTTVLAARYRLRHLNGSRPNTATWIYRNVVGRSLFSRCRMLPSDSEAFNLRAKACGPLRALVLGTSRLLLEEAAHPSFLKPMTVEGRIRWLDLPGGDPCGF
jgi:putative component of membrane protein insertase Oxa1/YidC/SpoIIIJ protein YidD